MTQETVTGTPMLPPRAERESHRRYRVTNALWPSPLPELSDREARFAARALFHKMFKIWLKPNQIVVKHQGRSWMNRWSGVVVNSRQGWHDVIHDWSHDVHHHLYPNEKGHGPHHNYVERQMIEEVIARGYLTGRLKKEPKPQAKPDVKQQRYASVLARIKSWESKKKRAETSLKKLNAQRKYYESVLN